MRTLAVGMGGTDVQAWQMFLVTRGFTIGQVDGIFGPNTRQATIDFQTQQGLGIDGIVGPVTLARARVLGFTPPLVVFTKPRADTHFPIGEAVECAGLADGQITRIELMTDEQFMVPMVTLSNGQWEVANRFRVAGQRTITARGFDAAGIEIGADQIRVFIAPPDYRSFVAIPQDINKGLKPASQKTMLAVFGKPGNLTPECSQVTNNKLIGLRVTRNIGPFTVEGIAPAVDTIERVLAQVKVAEPLLYDQLGTAGMFCCRRVRTGPGQQPSVFFSNHAWGTAIDIKIKDSLDPVGDQKTQLGLLLLAPFFHAEKFFWGASFPLEDSMHFEASDDLIKDWKAQGLLGG